MGKWTVVASSQTYLPIYSLINTAEQRSKGNICYDAAGKAHAVDKFSKIWQLLIHVESAAAVICSSSFSSMCTDLLSELIDLLTNGQQVRKFWPIIFYHKMTFWSWRSYCSVRLYIQESYRKNLFCSWTSWRTHLSLLQIIEILRRIF